MWWSGLLLLPPILVLTPSSIDYQSCAFRPLTVPPSRRRLCLSLRHYLRKNRARFNFKQSLRSLDTTIQTRQKDFMASSPWRGTQFRTADDVIAHDRRWLNRKGSTSVQVWEPPSFVLGKRDFKTSCRERQSILWATFLERMMAKSLDSC